MINSEDILLSKPSMSLQPYGAYSGGDRHSSNNYTNACQFPPLNCCKWKFSNSMRTQIDWVVFSQRSWKRYSKRKSQNDVSPQCEQEFVTAEEQKE